MRIGEGKVCFQHGFIKEQLVSASVSSLSAFSPSLHLRVTHNNTVLALTRDGGQHIRLDLPSAKTANFRAGEIRLQYVYLVEWQGSSLGEMSKGTKGSNTSPDQCRGGHPVLLEWLHSFWHHSLRTGGARHLANLTWCGNTEASSQSLGDHPGPPFSAACHRCNLPYFRLHKNCVLDLVEQVCIRCIQSCLQSFLEIFS
jgi:hypothetical protein